MTTALIKLTVTIRFLYRQLIPKVITVVLLSCSISTFANEVILSPVVIRDGYESQISLDWPLSNPDEVFDSKYYKSDQQLAADIGINLEDHLYKTRIAEIDPSTNKIFYLYFNLASSLTCDRDYLIQKVRLVKHFVNENYDIVDTRVEYLVEVFKDNGGTASDRADRHIKQYSLQDA